MKWGFRLWYRFKMKRLTARIEKEERIYLHWSVLYEENLKKLTPRHFLYEQTQWHKEQRDRMLEEWNILRWKLDTL